MSTILIVDDELDIVDVLRDILVDEGYHVVTAANGEEALARISERRPDLVILDMMMPVMSGAELLENLERDGGLSNLPIIISSAGDGDSVARRYALPFLKKPFEIDELLGHVHRSLAN